MMKIRWKGQEYILTGDSDGAITTPERFVHGIVSIAHLYESGDIFCFGEKIGTKADIEFLGEIKDPEAADDCFDGLFGPSWE